MSLSNPCNWFISGSEQKKFTYEGGTKLFHFSPNDNGLSRYMDCNVIFFANDEAHALDVLKRMFKFRIECAKEKIEHSLTKGANNAHAQEFRENAMKSETQTTEYLNAIENGKVKVTLAPMNQLYQADWASNATILD